MRLKVGPPGHLPRCPFSGKIQFRTQAGAWREVQRLRKHPWTFGGKTLHAYQCPECQQWHVGNQHGEEHRAREKGRYRSKHRKRVLEE